MELLLSALLGGFLLFNSAVTPGRAEKAIESALRKTYPHATVNATVEGKRGRSVLKGNFRRVRLEISKLGDVGDLPFTASKATEVGRLGRLELALRDFSYNGVPVIASDFNFDNVSYDFNALRKQSRLSIVDCGPANLHLSMSAAALEPTFADSLEGVTDVKITLRDGLVHMDAKKTIPILRIGVPFHFTARPVVKNDSEIWLTDGRIAMENVTGFTLRVQNLLGDLNPVYAFDPDHKWPFRVKLSNVSARANMLDVNGDLVFVKPEPTP